VVPQGYHQSYCNGYLQGFCSMMKPGDLYRFNNYLHVIKEGKTDYWYHDPNHNPVSNKTIFNVSFPLLYLKTSVCSKCEKGEKVYHMYSLEHNKTFEFYAHVFPKFLEKIE
jgi:hypothetical protein